MKSGLETVPGLEENLRFTSYSLDPVIGKYFAQARFYDSRCGRMLSPDPVKRGLNSYHYCNDDPVNYEDSTGEIANILIGGALGAITGGAFGSSVGLPAALAADFVAGTVGSRGQGYNGGYAGALLGRAGSFSPYTYGRDPRSSCGGSRQTGKSLCYTTSRGYQYGATQTKETKSGKKYSLKGFIKETLSGGVMGGLSSAAFYGGGKAVESVRRGIQGRKRKVSKVAGFDTWLNGGKADNKVYHGFVVSKKKPVYTGITKQPLKARLYQHNHGKHPKNFVYSRERFGGLKRNQAIM